MNLFVHHILWSKYHQGRYKINKVTKTQLVTEPLNSAGAVLRFKRPKDKIITGMPLEPIPHERFSASTYYLEIET